MHGISQPTLNAFSELSRNGLTNPLDLPFQAKRHDRPNLLHDRMTQIADLSLQFALNYNATAYALSENMRP